MKVCWQKILIAGECLFSIAVIFLVLFGKQSIDDEIGFILSVPLASAVNILYFSVCIMCGLEFLFLVKKPHWARVITLFIFFLSSIFMWFESPVSQGVSAMMITSFIYVIMLIVAFIKCPNKVINSKRKFVLPNMFSTTSEFALFVGVGLPVTLGIIIAIVFLVLQNNFVYAIKIFGIYILFIFVFTLAIMCHFSWQVLSYKKTLDYAKFDKTLKKCYKCNITAEKRSYLLCFEVTFLFNINKKIADELFLSIIPPQKNTFYILQYMLTQLTYLLNNQDNQQFNDKLLQTKQFIKDKKLNQKNLLLRLEKFQLATLGTICIEDLNKYFPENLKLLKLVYLNNIYTRALFYDKINDCIKADALKKILLLRAEKLPELYKFAGEKIANS